MPNAHKSGIIRSLLRAAPVLSQETKWTEVQLQHLSHAWPDIRIATTFAKQDPHPQAGVAILIPAGWKLSRHKVLVEHYVVAACAIFQAAQFICLLKVQRLLSVRFLKRCSRLRHTLSSLRGILIAVTNIIRNYGKTFWGSWVQPMSILPSPPSDLVNSRNRRWTDF